ncbi:MAG: hypothetical protein QM723_25420 [Myxococcaceae bacterium]
MRPLIIAAMLCTWSACSCGSDPCTPTTGGTGFGGAGAGEGAEQIGFVGKPIDVTVDVVPTFTGCSNATAQRITSATAEVLDPSNQKVASTVTPPVDTNGDVSCTVTFTPAIPGPYHVVVRLNPNAGTVQRDVVAAVDRRSTAANTFALGTDHPNCNQIDFDGQTLLCLDQTLTLRTMRLNGGVGVTISAVPAYAFALTDGRVWVFEPQQGIVVYGLGSDGSLAYRASTVIGSQGVRTRILAQNDQALFLDDFGFQQLSFLSDGGFTSSGVTSLLNTSGAQWLPGVGTAVFVEGDAVCNFNLAGGVAPDPDAGSCESLPPSSVVGYDDDGVWWFDQKQSVLTGQTLFVSGWHSGQSHPTSGRINFLAANNPFPPLLQLQQASPLLFVMSATGNTVDVLLPRFDGNFTWFEKWPTFDTVATVNADSRYVWYVQNNVLTYYRRQ